MGVQHKSRIHTFGIVIAWQLSAWVKLPVHGFEPLLVHVRVNLRRRNIGVTEHLLDDTQIRTVSEQVGREAMPQKVGIHIFFQATGKFRCRCAFSQDLAAHRRDMPQVLHMLFDRRAPDAFYFLCRSRELCVLQN